MPPVEQTVVSPSEGGRRLSISELKMVEKVKDIPVVSDALEGLEKVTSSVSENSRVQSAKHFVEEGIKKLTENPTVQGGFKGFNENETIQQTMTKVKDTVYPRMAGAVGQLDTLACDGIETLTTKVPALSHPTPQLVQTTKETVQGYFSMGAEYIASFSVSQISLRLADKTLAIAEKSTKYFMSPKKEGALAKAYRKIRDSRRNLRALRRAGERRRYLAQNELERAGVVGWLASMLYLNSILKMTGLQLKAAAPAAKEESSNTEIQTEEGPQPGVEDLQRDLSGYRSEEDPDYEPDSSLDTLSSSTSEEEEGEGEEQAPGDTGSQGQDTEERAEESVE